MSRTYTKQEFQSLDFDDQLMIIEALMPDQYYEGQSQIDFYIPEDFDPESGGDFPVIPPEIEEEEHEKMKNLVSGLTDSLFNDTDQILFDLLEYKRQLDKSNQEFLNIQ